MASAADRSGEPGHVTGESQLPADPPQASHRSTIAPFHVPQGEFYMMGDNRQVSCDSRYWGTVKGTSIIGKVVVPWWHNSHPDLHLF
jgi:signal peptidase I